MHKQLRTTDHGLISPVEAALKAVGIDDTVFDAAIAAVEGGIDAFPRRITVLEEDRAAAVSALRHLGALPHG
jgi:hypothetical protein